MFIAVCFSLRANLWLSTEQTEQFGAPCCKSKDIGLTGGVMKKIAFKITRTCDGVFLAEKSSESNKRTRVADPIKVRSIGIRLTDRMTFVEIRFKTIHGDRQSKTFLFSYLQRKRWGDLQIRLGDQGYKWPENQKVTNEILRQLAAEEPKRRFVQVSAPAGTNPHLCCRVRCTARRGVELTIASIPTRTLTSVHSRVERGPWRAGKRPSRSPHASRPACASP
jgi:hypothetical protein